MIRSIQIENNQKNLTPKVNEAKEVCNTDLSIEQLIEKLLKNEIDIEGLRTLRCHIRNGSFNEAHLSQIIQRIYDLNDLYIFEISVVDGLMKKLNEFKNSWRNKIFTKKIKAGFRKKGSGNKIILAEGDSWFNYPIVLTDIIDRVIMEKKMAVYSIAASGDWLLNMLAKRQYIEELSVIHPDWFIISAGGNDLVGSRRLAAIIKDTPDGGEYEKNEWAKKLISNRDKEHTDFNKDKFDRGVQYLSYDFFALLMFFHLQYYFMLFKILCEEGRNKFGPIKIITQGYDFVIPDDSTGFGGNLLNWYKPVLRRLVKSGKWLKLPMQIRGINDPQTQRDILYSMIYLFNEMMIETGRLLNNRLKKIFNDKDNRVFHIDSRGAIDSNGWTDELHPDIGSFRKISKGFINCIDEKKPTYEHVFVINKQS